MKQAAEQRKRMLMSLLGGLTLAATMFAAVPPVAGEEEKPRVAVMNFDTYLLETNWQCSPRRPRILARFRWLGTHR